MPGAAAGEYTGGLVTLAAGGAGDACADALTGLPPPFSLGALVPAAAGELHCLVFPVSCLLWGVLR